MKIIVTLIFLLFAKLMFASQFLNIVPDVRSLGMGSVNNGISQEISSLYLNPAGLVKTGYYEFSFSHLMWPVRGLYFSDDLSIQYEYFCFAYKLKRSALGINISHYHQPDIKFGNSSYSIYSGFSSITFAYDLSFFQAGIRAKMVWEVLGKYNAKAFGMDFGLIRIFDFLKLYKESTPNFQAGISLDNIGSSLVLHSREEPLPLNMQIGFSYIFLKNNDISFLFANDLKYFFGHDNRDKKLEINTGMEYTFSKILNLRLGYIISLPTGSPADAGLKQSKYTGGVGVGYNISSIRLTAGYSYVRSLTYEEYYSHSVSITLSKVKK